MNMHELRRTFDISLELHIGTAQQAAISVLYFVEKNVVSVCFDMFTHHTKDSNLMHILSEVLQRTDLMNFMEHSWPHH